MLKIQKIDRIKGMFANGRVITDAGDYGGNYGRWRNIYYGFTIEGGGTFTDYEKELDIILNKNPNKNGKYEMFCMGLQSATIIELDLVDIQSASTLAVWITKVLKITKEYYENWYTKNTQNNI